MDVVNAEQARIAEEAGACAVMALERVPADIRAAGGVARMVSGLPLSVITAILVGYYIVNPAISCVVLRPRLGGARFRRPDGMKPCEHTKQDPFIDLAVRSGWSHPPTGHAMCRCRKT